MFVPQVIVIAAGELYRVDDMNVNFGSVDMSDELHDKMPSCPISQFRMLASLERLERSH